MGIKKPASLQALWELVPRTRIERVTYPLGGGLLDIRYYPTR